MKDLTRESLFAFMINQIDEITNNEQSDSNRLTWYKIRSIYKINLIVLKEIEEDFHKSEASNNIKIFKQLRLNIENILLQLANNELFINSNEIEILIIKFNNLEKDNINSKLKTPNIFNKLLKILMEWSDEVLNEEFYNVRKEVKKLNGNTHKKIFLSYAFEDHLYSLGLFYYFYYNNLHLYVDWLNNDIIMEVDELKETLYNHLNDSEQLLFLQSPNMELNIGGNPSIKTWCAWELGNFFFKNFNRRITLNDSQIDKEFKFYINIYQGTSNKKHKILEGLKELKHISSQGLS